MTKAGATHSCERHFTTSKRQNELRLTRVLRQPCPATQRNNHISQLALIKLGMPHTAFSLLAANATRFEVMKYRSQLSCITL